MAEMSELLSEMSDLRADNEVLHESLNELAGRYGGVTWDLIGAYSDDGGLDLDSLKSVSERLRDLAASNPLIKNAAQLRHGYVFSKGVEFTKVKPQAREVIDKPVNKRTLFSMPAWETLNLARLADGNLFVIYDSQKKLFTRVPLSEITALYSDPDSSERIWFVRRTWMSNNKRQQRWYPLSTYDGPRRTRIGEDSTTPVATNAVMFHEAYNRQPGWALGVPDAMAALSWAIAYSEYLHNNSKLVKAYAQIAFKVSSQTKKGVDRAAAQVVKGGGNVGGTAAMGAGNELTPVNATGSQVNFGNGQPLAAMVASSLGVSVIALLASPGAASGSYGAAATLDAPTIMNMMVLQAEWSLFFEDIFNHLKSKNAVVTFPNIEEDAAYRQVASVTQAYTSGAIFQDEYRAKMLELTGVDPLHPVGSLPEADEFNNGTDPSEAGVDPVSRQGNSGVAGGTEQNETNNDNRQDNISTGE